MKFDVFVVCRHLLQLALRADGLRGTDIVPGTAAGTATGIAGVVRDVIVSLAAGFARALGGQGFCYE